MFKTLFLDRDGVINVRLIDDYVCTPEQFVFEERVLDALTILRTHFDRIVVVTNQQGIGKGLMTEAELHRVHQKLMDAARQANAPIDAIYYCPNLAKDHSPYRKPAIGMGLKARRDCPNIRFKDAVMVGDSGSDVRFGKRLCMQTVFISKNLTEIRKVNPDLAYESLYHYACSLKSYE